MSHIASNGQPKFNEKKYLNSYSQGTKTFVDRRVIGKEKEGQLESEPDAGKKDKPPSLPH